MHVMNTIVYIAPTEDMLFANMELSYRTVLVMLVTLLADVTFAQNVHSYKQLNTPIDCIERQVPVETQLFPSGNGDLKILGILSQICYFLLTFPATELEKSDLDDRNYRLIELPNKLQVLLVSDNKSNVASAALAVGG